MGIVNLFTRSSKAASGIAIPDVNSLPESERPKALQDVVSIINVQRIAFGFRKVDPDAQGQEILKSVAEGMSLLSEYVIRVEGHSNLTKTEDKLTAQDQARIKKLSEDRADACARLLKASGVKNEITCVGQGALKGEAKGCVRLVVCKKCPPEVNDSQVEQPEIKAAEIDLPQVEAEKPGTLTPEANVEDASVVQTTGDQVQEEQSSPEEGQKPSADPQETDGPGKMDSLTGTVIEPAVNPADVDFKVVEPASGLAVVVEAAKATSDPPAPACAPAQFEAWEPTKYVPWYIAWCTSKPTVDECPIEGLTVKQMQVLQ